MLAWQSLVLTSLSVCVGDFPVENGCMADFRADFPVEHSCVAVYGADFLVYGSF